MLTATNSVLPSHSKRYTSSLLLLGFLLAVPLRAEETAQHVYLDARSDYGGVEGPLPLTPEHKTYTVLVYEKHGAGRIGLEAYYTGPQTLADGGLLDHRRDGRAPLRPGAALYQLRERPRHEAE